MNSGDEGGKKIVCVNRKARFNYQILETFEAGLVLTGAEIKSVRKGEISLEESYIAPRNGELWLLNAHVKGYQFSDQAEYDPVRRRKLLMHKHEINKLTSRVEQKGLTLVPLQLYLRKGRAKLELALAKGKAAPDKRQTIKEREADREARRAMRRS